MVSATFPEKDHAMSLTRTIRIHVGVWISLLGMLTTPAHGEVTTSDSSLLPVETVLELSMENMAEFAAAWLQTPLGRTLAEPAITEFRRDQEEAEVVSALCLQPLFGLDWSDLAEVDGPVTLAACPVANQAMEWMLLLEPDAQKQAVASFELRIQDYFLKRGYRRESRELAGQKVVQFRRQRNDQSENRWLSTTPRGILISNGESFLPEVLTKLASSPPTPRSAADPLACRILIRPLALAQSAGGQRAQDARTAERLGFSHLDRFAGQMKIQPAATTVLQIEGEWKAAAKLEKAARLLDFSSGKQASQPPALVPGTDTINIWRWNVSDALPAIGNMLDEWMEPGPDGEGLFEDLLDGMRDDPEGPQVDLRRDLFARLGPRVVGFGLGTDAGSSGRQRVLIAECDAPQVVRAMLTKMYQLDQAVRFEELAGYAFWSVSGQGSLFIDAESPSMPTIRAVAINQKQFLASTNADLLRTLCTKPSPESDRNWSRLSREANQYQPKEIGGRSLILARQRLESPYQQLAAGQTPVGLEATLLAWFLLGSAFDPAQRPANLQLPAWSHMQGVFLPSWIQYRRDPKSLWMQAGLISESTP